MKRKLLELSILPGLIVLGFVLIGGVGVLLDMSFGQESTQPATTKLRVRTTAGWVSVQAAGDATFSVDGNVVFVEGISTEPMSFSVSDKGVLEVSCNGWQYEASAPFTMKKDGRELVSITMGGSSPSVEDEAPPVDGVKVIDGVEVPVSPPAATPPREPAAKKAPR